MKNILIKILTYLVMIPIVCIGIVFGIIWNSYLIWNYIWVRLVRKWKAGIKEVKKSDEYK
jgi:DUF1365 family protein